MKQEISGSAKIEPTNREMKNHKELITPCQNQSRVRHQGKSPHQCAFSSNRLLHLYNELDITSTRNYAKISSMQEKNSFNHYHIQLSTKNTSIESQKNLFIQYSNARAHGVSTFYLTNIRLLRLRHDQRWRSTIHGSRWPHQRGLHFCSKTPP